MRHELVSIIIPAYNEAATIDAVLARVAAIDLTPLGLARELLVVDDGSSDGTAARVWGRPDVRLVRHAVNRGKGAAILTGLHEAHGDLVVIQDGDLEYDPADLPALLAPLAAGRTRVVYGTRFARGWPARMRTANFCANRLLTWLANRLYHVRLTDEATGYKAFDTALLRSLPLAARGFDFCPEVTALLGSSGEPIVEVPIRYRARSVSDGKKIGWRDGVQAAAVLLRLRRARRPHAPVAPATLAEP
jgi:glycosyltransferase involved in cell wall biosynthesis